jgi:hypothetical protein
VIRSAVLAFGLALVPVAGVAQGSVEARGILSDDDFYRLVACAASPGEACPAPMLRWEVNRPIRVALRRIDAAFIGRRAKVADAALALGLRQLNALKAGFRLARVPAGEIAEIEVFFLDIPPGTPISGTGIDGVDGMPLDGASAFVMADLESGHIEDAAIVVSSALETEAFGPAMLTQLFRAMGLTTRIAGSAYSGVSVLGEQDKTAKALGLQDIMALRRHYARN